MERSSQRNPDAHIAPDHDAIADGKMPATAVLPARKPGSLDHAAASFRRFLSQRGAADVDSLASWCASFDGRPDHGALFRDWHLHDPAQALSVAEALSNLPKAGERFAGFELLQELGQGAFGRVFLASQADLSDRFVVLKVTADQRAEHKVLARLQHTNVVPVYSVHQNGPLHAVCMPYLGGTTLADIAEHLHSLRSLPMTGKAIVEALHQHRSRALPATEVQTTQLRTQPAPSAHVDQVMYFPSVNDNRANATLTMLERLSYVDSVLWLISRLADGLAHAHERGILHSDLKPANVLLSDDGQPMLLDFNLAVDTQHHMQGHMAFTGGTFPYMAPEHLELFHSGMGTVDHRSDLYSLGILLAELLTCRHQTTPAGATISEALPVLLARRQRLPEVRALNKAVPPAAEAIVRHCLQVDQERRYQSARQIQEDIDRHLADLPLKHAPNPSLLERGGKWKRRHPRITSLTTCAIAVVLTGIALTAALMAHERHVAEVQAEQNERIARLEALQTWQQFDKEMRTAQLGVFARVGDRADLQRGLAACRRALGIYQVLDDPEWRDLPAISRLPEEARSQLPEQVADLLLLLARGSVNLAPDDKAVAAEALRWNQLAEACYPNAAAPRAVWEQRASLQLLLGDEKQATELRDKSLALPLRTAQEYYWSAVDLFLSNHPREAVPLLEEAVRIDPRHIRGWFVLARCYDADSRNLEAAQCYGTCTALEPQFVWSWYNRGLAQLRLGRHAKALLDFNRVIELQAQLTEPQRAETLVNRSFVYQGLGKSQEAIDDLTRALNQGAPPTYVYFTRARLWDKLGEKAKAKEDRSEGLRREPADEKSWIARGLARKSSDPRGALADLESALALNPTSVDALQNVAHVYADVLPAKTKAEKNDFAKKALAALDKALVLQPDYVPARSGRGVLLARLGNRTRALADAQAVLLRDTSGQTVYEVACIYALTAKQNAEDRLEAFRLLSTALRQGFGYDILETDTDLIVLRSYPEFRKLAEAAKTLRAAK